MTKKALIVFTRNPELGKCKTRLAKSIGNVEALKVYKHLINHTASIASSIKADTFIFYSENIIKNDAWSDDLFKKRLQQGDDLGQRMQNAFNTVFKEGYNNVIIIGSDLLDLNKSIIEEAFKALNDHDIAIGPAKDGGYYLLGLKKIHQDIFKINNWGTSTVYKQTLSKIAQNKVHVLEVLNDIDYIEDLKPYKIFDKYFKN